MMAMGAARGHSLSHTLQPTLGAAQGDSQGIISELSSACRFHLLKPEYVHHRIKQLQRGYRLRIILCHVDIEDVVESLSQVQL